MIELFPMACGLAVGVVLALFVARLRLLVGVIVAVLLGVAATVLSGEYRISWDFLLIDVPLVGLSAAIALVAARTLWRSLSRRLPD
jgi:hypothetical protein